MKIYLENEKSDFSPSLQNESYCRNFEQSINISIHQKNTIGRVGYESNLMNSGEKQKDTIRLMDILKNKLSNKKLYSLLDKNNLEETSQFSNHLNVEFSKNKMEEFKAMKKLAGIMPKKNFTY